VVYLVLTNISCIGMFIKKVVSIFDPIPIPNLGKIILQNVINNLNLALQVANPAFKDDISKWECTVPDVPTNSHGYESFNSLRY
jgi:hypothetical protein